MTDDRPRLPRPLAAALAVLSLLAWAAPAGAATWYVRQSGNDSNSGTSPGQAFRTLQRAADMDTNSDYVLIGAGTYTESVSGIEDGADGAWAYWLADVNGTYTGDAGPVVWRPANGGTYAVRLENEHHVILRGFDFEANPNAADAAGVLLPDAYAIGVVDCTFTGLKDGILADGSGGFAAVDCTFTDCNDGAEIENVSATFTDCTVTGGSDGLDCDFSGVTVSGCAFSGQGDAALDVDDAAVTVTDCTFAAVSQAAVDCNNAALTMTDCAIDTPMNGNLTIGVRLSATEAALARCAVSGGDYGLVRSNGGAFLTLTDCTIAGATAYGAYVGGESTTVAGCLFDANEVGLGLIVAGGPEPRVEDTVIRDGTWGVYTGWANHEFRTVTLTGHAGAALRVYAPVVTDFALDAADTLTVEGNAVGLLWDRTAGSPGTAGLTVAGQNWSGNGSHVRAVGVEAVDVRDSTFAGGHDGVTALAADALTVVRCEFADVAGDGGGGPEDFLTRGGVYAETAALTAADCLFERCCHGIKVAGAADPDLRRCVFRDGTRTALDIQDGSWTYAPADDLRFENTAGWGLYLRNLAPLSVDGGAAGLTLTAAPVGTPVDGPVLPGTAPYGAMVRDCPGATVRNVTATGGRFGFVLDGAPGSVIEDCAAEDCLRWGFDLRGDGGGGLIAAADGLTVADCGGGLRLERLGAGHFLLNDVACARPATFDADGVPAGAVGHAFFLLDGPLDPARHTNLSATGYAYGIHVEGAALTVTPASAATYDLRGCEHGLRSGNGPASVTGWYARGNAVALLATGAAAAHPLALTDCDLFGRRSAVDVYLRPGDVTLTDCGFESRTGDAVNVDLSDGAAFAATGCYVTDAGLDAFAVDGDGGGVTLDAVAFTECAVLACGGDGFEVEDAASAAFLRCAASAAGDDGFDVVAADVTYRDCAASGAADDGFKSRGAGAATLAERCFVSDIGGRAFLIAGGASAALRACQAWRCGEDAVWVNDTPGVTVDNLLAVDCRRAVDIDGGTVAVRHLTAVAARNEAVLAWRGSVTVANSVLGGTVGARRNAGNGASLALDRVLIDAAAPYEDVPPGPHDLLKNPRFRDPAAGDYRLAEGSPAINVGADLTAVTDDLLGLPRPAHRRHDLGAYEYQEAGGSLRILDWKERAL